ELLRAGVTLAVEFVMWNPKDTAGSERRSAKFVGLYLLVVIFYAERLFPAIDAEGRADAFAIVIIDQNRDVVKLVYIEVGVFVQFVELVKLIKIALMFMEIIPFQQRWDSIAGFCFYFVVIRFSGVVSREGQEEKCG